jgi:hypothetical protein
MQEIRCREARISVSPYITRWDEMNLKYAIFIILAFLVLPSMAIQYAGDAMYNYAIQSPDVGNARVSMDLAHIGVTITPSQYATSWDSIFPHVLAGYIYILNNMPDYNGYLRIGILADDKTMYIYEVEAYQMREAIKKDDLEPVISDMFAKSKIQTDHQYDSYAGNWLDDRSG